MAVRNLYAAATNLCAGAADTTVADLKLAAESLKPLIDAHFASNAHAIGTIGDDEP
jgi:hypothetical protein